MVELRAQFDAPPRVERGDLWAAIARRSGGALATGAIEPILTEIFRERDGGMPFVVRAASDSAARQRRLSARSDRRNETPS